MSKDSKLWDEFKNRGESIGRVFLIVGLVVLSVQFVLVICGLRTETGLLGASLGLLSVGLGFIAMGMSRKADRNYTNLLNEINKKVTDLPRLLKGDTLTPYGQQVAAETEREAQIERSKVEAQKRLDEDTERVGYVRGELKKNDDGTWSIAWGGKYPL